MYDRSMTVVWEYIRNCSPASSFWTQVRRIGELRLWKNKPAHLKSDLPLVLQYSYNKVKSMKLIQNLGKSIACLRGSLGYSTIPTWHFRVPKYPSTINERYSVPDPEKPWLWLRKTVESPCRASRVTTLQFYCCGCQKSDKKKKKKGKKAEYQTGKR